MTLTGDPCGQSITWVVRMLSVAVIASLSSTARADLYSIDFFPSGLQTNHILQLGFLPSLVVPDLVGGSLDDARLVMDFTTANDFDAANLFLLRVARTPDSPAAGAWAVTGADLGWSGQGHFSTDISTSELNGVIVPGAWTFDLYATEGDPPVYSGTFSDDSRIDITYTPVPEPGAASWLAGLLAACCSRRRPR